MTRGEILYWIDVHETWMRDHWKEYADACVRLGFRRPDIRSHLIPKSRKARWMREADDAAGRGLRAAGRLAPAEAGLKRAPPGRKEILGKLTNEQFEWLSENYGESLRGYVRQPLEMIARDGRGRCGPTGGGGGRRGGRDDSGPRDSARSTEKLR